VAIVLCAAVCVASAEKLLASYSRQLNRRENNRIKRLVKRQALNDPNCDRRACAIPNCGKDFVAAALPGDCCEKCVPWEYASSLGIQYPQAPQPVYDPRAQYQPPYDPYNRYPYNPPQPQPQPYQPQRVDVYIFGPDDGARVGTGQSIYLDCEVVSPYNQNAQPRWSRPGNQPLSYKSQVTALAGNRKISRLTITDASHGDAGRYECNAGTGNANDQASIDLQVADGGYFPRPAQPQQPQYDPYNQYPYNQPGQYPQQPQPQPHPQPQPQPGQHDHHPAPPPDAEGGEDGEDAGVDEEGADSAAAKDKAAKATTAAPAAHEGHEPAAPADGGAEDEGEYPEDYTENEK